MEITGGAVEVCALWLFPSHYKLPLFSLLAVHPLKPQSNRSQEGESPIPPDSLRREQERTAGSAVDTFL
jgi:hypothetical protein